MLPVSNEDSADVAQRAALVRQRRLATGLLVVMACIYAATRVAGTDSFWVALVQAASEAALVGGLADWFAVTALFRHPFNVPIPHTAIIPRNKKRIGIVLGRFVERHFLEPGLLAQKLRSLDVGGRLGRWLAVPGNAGRVGRNIAAILPWAIKVAEDRQVREFVHGALHRQMERVNFAPLLGTVLEVFSAGRRHQELFDRALVIANEWLLSHEERIYLLVSDKSRWWVPPSIDRGIARKILQGLYELLDELSDHNHDARRGFDHTVDDLIARLKNSPEMAERVEALKHDLLASPLAHGYFTAVWEELRERVLNDAQRDDSRLVDVLSRAFAALGASLMADEDMRKRLDRRVEALALEFTRPWRAEIGAFIAEVVEGWDTATLTDRLELTVGRDLQFIRINGTLVGALVGTLLFLGSMLLFP